jgi:two-component system response regulator YesN
MKDKKYSVMVVEDEVLLRENIARKISGFSPAFCIAGTAADGAEALALLKKCKPDIIITDIVMPVMNGLDFIKKAAAISPEVQFVVLSGYSDFEYAKTALQYGVRDYLLKPLSEKVLQEILIKLSKDIEYTSDAAASTYLHSLLNSPATEEMVLYYRNSTFDVVLISMGNYVFHRLNYDSEEYFESFWQSIDIDDISSKIGPEFGRPMLCSSSYPNERIMVFSNLDATPDRFRSYTDKLCRLLNPSSFTLPVTVCSTSSSVTAQELFIIVKKLRKLYNLNYRPWQPQPFQLTQSNEPMFSGKSVNAVKIDNIISHFQNAQMQPARNELTNALYAWLQSGICLDQFFNNLQILLYSLRRSMPQIQEATWDNLCREVFLSLSISGTYDDFLNELFDLLSRHFTCHGEDVNAKRTIEKVRIYIAENFNQPISIFDIANRFHISSSHLSRLFKSFYGHSPVHFLISLRIQQACELMRQSPDLEFKYISELIGYNDQHYFSKLFKKHTGFAPTEYRNKIERGEKAGER